MRKSTSDYTFHGTNVNIPKGQEVWIPIYAIQRDPNIYPEPDVFDPERFDEENVQARQAAFYSPFGDGPKSCIGELNRILNISFTIKNFIRITFNWKHFFLNSRSITSYAMSVFYFQEFVSQIIKLKLGLSKYCETTKSRSAKRHKHR